MQHIVFIKENIQFLFFDISESAGANIMIAYNIYVLKTFQLLFYLVFIAVYGFI